MSRKRQNKRKQRQIQSNTPKFPTLLEVFRARTHNQADYIDSMYENDITLCCGPAGTGKSALAVYQACKCLLNDEYEKIIITRPAVEASGESLGFLPGSADSKLYPYLIPIIEFFKKIIGSKWYETYKREGRIEIVPLALMRGRNFDNAFIICDEAENANFNLLKLLLTRIGFKSKMVISGDFNQSDINLDNNDFKMVFNKLANVPRIGCVSLTDVDIIRNPIISEILKALEN